MDDVCTGRLVEDSEAQETRIDIRVSAKISGVRWLPRRLRAGTRRELYEWLRVDLKSLRDRKAAQRRAELELGRKLLGFPLANCGIVQDRRSNPRGK